MPDDHRPPVGQSPTPYQATRLCQALRLQARLREGTWVQNPDHRRRRTSTVDICLTRIAPGRPVGTSVLGRPAASGASSPGQFLGLLGLLDKFFLNGLDNFLVEKCRLAPGRGESGYVKEARK